MPKTLVIIKHGIYEPWLSIFKNGQMKTCLTQQIPSDLEVIHYYGIPGNKIFQTFDEIHERLRHHSKYLSRILRIIDITVSFPYRRKVPNVQVGNRLPTDGQQYQVNIFDSVFNLRRKQLGIYSYLLKNFQFDFIYETTTSSYIKFDSLIENIKCLPQKNVYAGSVPYVGANFVSGANRFMSRDVVQLLVDKRKKWRPDLLEDVAIGKLLVKIGLEISEMPTINLESIEQISTTSQNDLEKNFHFRLKSYSRQERIDDQIMRELHNRLNENGEI